jgi:eukaryotic-like serine/threonine-protein kinase
MVADFGQARKFNPSTGAVKAPPLYDDAMPPETISLGVGTIQSDLFQVGLLLYRAANGEPFYKPQVPTVNIDDKILRGAFPNRSAFMPHVPKRLRTVIRKALKVKPSDRFSSASEMSTALGRVLVEVDWETSPLGTHGLEWKATRASRPTLIVKLIENNQNYDVEQYTESTAGARARDKDSWRKGLTRDDALDYLESIFSAA